MRIMKLFSFTMLLGFFLPLLATNLLNCGTDTGGYQHCPLPDANRRDIRITNIREGNCNIDNTWGVDRTGVWVDRGCDAQFEYTQVGPLNPFNDLGEMLIAPDFVEPIYVPGAYYGAGLYETNDWSSATYCATHECNLDQQHIDTSLNNIIETNVSAGTDSGQNTTNVITIDQSTSDILNNQGVVTQTNQGTSEEAKVNPGKSDEAQANQGTSQDVKVNQGKSAEAQANQGTSQDVKVNQGKSAEAQANQGTSQDVKVNQGKSAEAQANQGSSEKIKVNHGKSKEKKANHGHDKDIVIDFNKDDSSAIRDNQGENIDINHMSNQQNGKQNVGAEVNVNDDLSNAVKTTPKGSPKLDKPNK